jgi:hypothetical protein
MKGSYLRRIALGEMNVSRAKAVFSGARRAAPQALTWITS